MSDKYKVRDEQSGREFTIERELSPTERAERVGREASMWFWVFAIFGGFIILIAIWVIKTLADLTRRYPVIMIPVLIGSLMAGIYALNASIRQAEVVTTLIRVHTLNVVYHREQSSSSFTVSYQLFNDDTKGRRVGIGVQVPVTFTGCKDGGKQVPDRTVTFGESSGSLFVVQTVGAAAHASSTNTVDAAWSNEGSSPGAYLERCQAYKIGQPVYQIRVDGPFGSEWRSLAESGSTQNAATPIVTNTAVAANGPSVEQPTIQSNVSVVVGHVTADLKLHTKPGINEPTIIVLKTGTEVILLGDTVSTPDGVTWVKVQAGQQEGWCSAKFVTQVARTSPSPTKVGDLSGFWTGILRQGQAQFSYQMTLVQHGQNVEGTARIEEKGSPQYYGVMKLRGTVSQDGLHFEETQTIESASRSDRRWCLKSGELTYAASNGVPSLQGQWTSPDCSPGEIEIRKQQ